MQAPHTAACARVVVLRAGEIIRLGDRVRPTRRLAGVRDVDVLEHDAVHAMRQRLEIRVYPGAEPIVDRDVVNPREPDVRDADTGTLIVNGLAGDIDEAQLNVLADPSPFALNQDTDAL